MIDTWSVDLLQRVEKMDIAKTFVKKKKKKKKHALIEISGTITKNDNNIIKSVEIKTMCFFKWLS